jgi:2-keto-4-pentenoate hydratase/2-oxohepta-3-ene-1,7-dioic acid hydratase in catechol pathway
LNITIDNKRTLKAQTIYGIGRNYADHAKELNNPVPAQPVVFMKAPASLRALDQGPLAFPGEVFHHEAELVLLIDKLIPMGSLPTEDDVAAITLGLDLTRREVQAKLKEKGLPWTTAKSFAGSALIADFESRELVGALSSLGFTLTVNGELRQTGWTKDMLFTVPAILKFLTSLAPLLPGDIIYTGTPAGVGPIKKGDVFELAYCGRNKSFKGCL